MFDYQMVSVCETNTVTVFFQRRADCTATWDDCDISWELSLVGFQWWCFVLLAISWGIPSPWVIQHGNYRKSKKGLQLMPQIPLEKAGNPHAKEPILGWPKKTSHETNAGIHLLRNNNRWPPGGYSTRVHTNGRCHHQGPTGSSSEMKPKGNPPVCWRWFVIFPHVSDGIKHHSRFKDLFCGCLKHFQVKQHNLNDLWFEADEICSFAFCARPGRPRRSIEGVSERLVMVEAIQEPENCNSTWPAKKPGNNN